MRAVLAASILSVVLAGCSMNQPGSVETGEDIYARLCANCHGADLGGLIGPAIGPGSNTAGQPDEFLEITILRGRGSMPSFSSSLDDGQLERLISYIRAEQGK